MNDDKYTAIGLHKLAQQGGDGLVPELLEGMRRAEPREISSGSPSGAEIVRLPGLHERGGRSLYPAFSAQPASIIPFPAPKWQRNEERRNRR